MVVYFHTFKSHTFIAKTAEVLIVNIFKGFAHIGALTDNAPGVVAPVGELSKLSLTFTRETTLHVSADFPNETLVGFVYKENDVSITPVPTVTTYSCLRAINWTYTQARLGSFDETKDFYQQQFIQNFGADFDLIDSGRMIAFGNYYAPEYIVFAPKNQSGTSNWKIWFSDDSFFNQFDEFLIVPIVPLVPLDQFFGDYDTVKGLVAAISQSDTFDRIAKARGVYPNTYPETYQRNDEFLWQDKNNHALKINTNWVTLVYGAAGNNLDAVKEAIRAYILTPGNSAHTRDEWAEIFPDIFTSTEFIITPLWNDYSVPAGDRNAGVYSGLAHFQDAMTLAHKTCKGIRYTDAHIDAVITDLPTQFRSLQSVVVGGPENRDGLNKFRDRYPDYMNVPTTHVDFGLMSEETRQFCMMLAEMLLLAEELTLNSGVPLTYNRLVRDGVVYLAKSYKNFLYLVVTKQSVQATLTTGG